MVPFFLTGREVEMKLKHFDTVLSECLPAGYGETVFLFKYSYILTLNHDENCARLGKLTLRDTT